MHNIILEISISKTSNRYLLLAYQSSRYSSFCLIETCLSTIQLQTSIDCVGGAVQCNTITDRWQGSTVQYNHRQMAGQYSAIQPQTDCMGRAVQCNTTTDIDWAVWYPAIQPDRLWAGRYSAIQPDRLCGQDGTVQYNQTDCGQDGTVQYNQTDCGQDGTVQYNQTDCVGCCIFIVYNPHNSSSSIFEL